MISATVDQLPAGMPNLRPEHVLGSRTFRASRPDGTRYYALETWFIDRHGEKDCWIEVLGEVD